MDLLFRIFMSHTDHLREINDDRFVRFPADENVELVEVTMYQTGECEIDDDVHQFRIELSWVGYRFDRASVRQSLDFWGTSGINDQ